MAWKELMVHTACFHIAVSPFYFFCCNNSHCHPYSDYTLTSWSTVPGMPAPLCRTDHQQVVSVRPCLLSKWLVLDHDMDHGMVDGQSAFPLLLHQHSCIHKGNRYQNQVGGKKPFQTIALTLPLTFCLLQVYLCYSIRSGMLFDLNVCCCSSGGGIESVRSLTAIIIYIPV